MLDKNHFTGYIYSKIDSTHGDYIMPRIEILFDKESSNKPSEKVRDALRERIIQKVGNKYGFLNVRVALSSSTSLIISGTKNDDDAKEINQIIEEIWLDDSWVPA